MTSLGCPSCRKLFSYEYTDKKNNWPPICPLCGQRKEFICWAGRPEWEKEQARLWETVSVSPLV